MDVLCSILQERSVSESVTEGWKEKRAWLWNSNDNKEKKVELQTQETDSVPSREDVKDAFLFF